MKEKDRQSINSDKAQSPWENDEDGEEENEVVEGKEFEEKIEKDKYFEIKKILNEKKNSFKLWKYKTKKDGSTLLFHSIVYNSTRIAKEIIRYCRNNLSKEELKDYINQKNENGITALHFASFKGNIIIIDRLIFYGADIKAPTNKFLNVIDFACQGNKPNSLVYFDFYYDFKMDAQNINDKITTPLHWACYSSSYECVEFLLNKDVKINIQDKKGNTPLHMAVMCGITKIVRLLLQKGALTNIKNEEGETPIELALKKKRLEIYNILKNNSKCSIFNFRAPVKKIEKTKKYIFIGTFYKIFTGFILLCNIFPFLFDRPSNCFANIIIIFIFLIVNVVFTVLYIYLICSDPGYIKDNEKITDIQTLLFKQKYDFKNFCFKCSVYKSEDLKHCVICDKCCKDFDHHCFWLNNCIGQNNYYFFIILLYTVFFDFISMVLVSIYSLFISYKIIPKKNQNCFESNFAGSIYNFVKNIISILEVKYGETFIIPEKKVLKIYFYILVSINIAVLIPLMYLVNIHTKSCKSRRKVKTTIKKSDLNIQNINPDELLEENYTDNDTSLDS